MNHKLAFQTGIALLAGAACWVPIAVNADSGDLIEQELVDRAETLRSADDYQIEHTYIGSLNTPNRWGEQTLKVNIRRGVEYVLVGACDENCEDVDLTIYNPQGEIVTTDTAMGDAPLLVGASAQSGTFYIEVYMPTCSAEACRYGVSILSR